MSITSCGDKKPTLCECVELGKEVDRISESFFERSKTKEGKDSLDFAIKNRDRVCIYFQNMLADELQKKAKECESLEFSPEE